MGVMLRVQHYKLCYLAMLYIFSRNLSESYCEKAITDLFAMSLKNIRKRFLNALKMNKMVC